MDRPNVKDCLPFIDRVVLDGANEDTFHYVYSEKDAWGDDIIMMTVHHDWSCCGVTSIHYINPDNSGMEEEEFNELLWEYIKTWERDGVYTNIGTRNRRCIVRLSIPVDAHDDDGATGTRSFIEYVHSVAPDKISVSPVSFNANSGNNIALFTINLTKPEDNGGYFADWI